MTLGVLVGAAAGLGILLVVARLTALGPPSLADRVAMHLRRPALDAPLMGGGVSSTVEGLLSPHVRTAAVHLERIMGGGAAVQRRLLQAGGTLDLQQFRMQQVLWSASFFAASVLLSLAMLAGGSTRSPGLLVLFCAGMAVAGVLARDQALSREIRRRESRIVSELPTVADLLAVSVAAGESPSAALERTARVTRGELGHELELVLNDVRIGSGLVHALDAMSRRVSVPAVTRFVDGIAVAVERGTPLADVLRSQAADAREVRKRTLMEIGGARRFSCSSRWSSWYCRSRSCLPSTQVLPSSTSSRHERTPMTNALVRAQVRLSSQRGDVPGWVLITIMTAGIVAVLWQFAEPYLRNVLADSLDATVGR